MRGNALKGEGGCRCTEPRLVCYTTAKQTVVILIQRSGNNWPFSNIVWETVI